MRGLQVASYTWVVLAIAPAISQSRPNPFPHRDGIRLQVEVQSATLPMTVRLRFLTAGDSLQRGIHSLRQVALLRCPTTTPFPSSHSSWGSSPQIRELP
jgi:hypothetical protein